MWVNGILVENSLLGKLEVGQEECVEKLNF